MAGICTSCLYSSVCSTDPSTELHHPHRRVLGSSSMVFTSRIQAILLKVS